MRRQALAAALALAGIATEARAQWVTSAYEQFYLQAPHNWTFRNRYMAADRLFNAFDYGHAILYETLWTKPDAPASQLEAKEYDFLTKKVLVRPPRVPLEEAAIEIRYARLAPEAKAMFEWAHILHRQIYDVLADERLNDVAKDAEVARLLGYYKTRPDLAFSSKPKSMELMQEQPYSLAFRQKYPKFNALIWGYHWLQVGLYEPLLVGKSSEERQAGVRATVARFWQMLGDPTRSLPYQMPMTAAVAPRFAARYPEAAIIFDNLHSMHDVISDVLANPSVRRDRKRDEIMLAARRYRDDTSYVMPVEAWRTMAQHMGIENMGGPAVGFLPVLPTPTVTYGAVMTHDDSTGAMTGFKYGQATGGAHAAHGAAAAPAAAQATIPATGDSSGGHSGHGTPARDSTAVPAPSSDSSAAAATEAHGGAEHARMLEMHSRMLADPTIRRRMLADTSMRRMVVGMLDELPAKERERVSAWLRDTASTSRAAPARRPAQRQPAAARPQTTPADPHAGHGATPAPKPPVKQSPKPAAKPAADPHAGHKP